MIKLVLVRHGQSMWNLENKFTGWTDVELSEKGVEEAKEAGKVLKEQGFHFDLAFTSVLKRAEDTLDYILKEMGEENIEIKRSWKLNERHYGALQGLNKDETREKYAKDLSNSINIELEELEMKNATINVKVEYKANEYFENGKDSVQIYIRTNIGENESELVKIASGGEMSRIMLAIKKVIAEADEVPVMIFDEIDTGISGKAANAVADKMKSISKNHQVLCISHLAAIAASANYNYFISKKVENERTATKVKLLNEKEVLCEIARISSGEVNEVTLQYANELRKKVS